MTINMKNDAGKRSIGDIMVCVMSRLLKDGETVFTGLASHMPVVAIHLARALHAPKLWQLNTSGGICPTSLTRESFTSIGDGMRMGSVGDFPLDEVFDLSVRGGLDVAFLSGAQFDPYGSVNSSVIGSITKPKVKFPGGAGSAIILPTAKRVIAWRTRHDKRTFVEKVDFVTAKGNIDRIVTNLCVLRFDSGELRLESIHPGVSIEDVRANTGFDLDCSQVEETPPPTYKELGALRSIDPKGLRYMEL